MLRNNRRYFFATLATALLVSAIVGITQIVSAEGNNQFPGVNSGNEWNADNRSPDPRLTWLYKDNGPNETINGTTTHILRNRNLGRNIGTTLRVYYNYRPQFVRVTVNVVDCQLDAYDPYDGRVQVELGGSGVYNQQTRAPLKEDHYYIKKEFLAKNTERVTTTQDFVTGTERHGQSPVCGNYGAYDVPDWVDREGCNNWNPPPNGAQCSGVGNSIFTLDKVGNGTHQVPGTDTKLDGRTFTVGFPGSGNGNGQIGFDPAIGLFFADLDIRLTAGDDSNVPPDVMQRMSFRVVANDVPRSENGNNMNAKMGYRFDQPDQDASKYFGLQGNGGGNNRYDGYGQKFAVPFGLTCLENTQQDRRIQIYDPDVNGYGPSYAAVFKKGPQDPNDPNSPIVIERLKQNEYNLGLGSNVAWDNSTDDRIRLTAGNNANSIFTIREMSKGYQYMLVIVNPEATSFPPSTNVWSIKLPSDSINGLINCRYNLVPSLNGVKATFSAYGDTLNPHGWITNTEGTNATGDHEWRITRAVFATRPADANRTTVANSNDNEQPCQFVTRLSGAPQSCASAFTATFPGDDDETLNQGAGPNGVGTYVCYMTSVKDPSWLASDDNKWAHSPMQCSVAGVKPKIQAWGYDTKATGRIKTSLSEAGGIRYGSWAEYGLLSNGTNMNMGSGNGLLGGVGAGTPQGNWSPLTFANDSGSAFSCGFGCYGGINMPSISTQGATDRADGTTFNSYADLAMSKGKIRINGTLFINGNITYPDSTTGISGLSKVQLIANDIVIGPNVTRIDPWLIAVGTNGTNGRISTCSQAQQAGNYFVPMQNANLRGGVGGICTNPIKFNSPLIADKVYLYRTYDEQNGAQAAETLNVRADNFLSSYVGGGTPQPVAVTESVTELPPRF